MSKKYTQEEILKLFKKLPEELKEAIYSDETANHILDICERNKIEKGSIGVMVSDVLYGLLPLNEFQKTIEQELKLEEEKAKKITREVSRFIFYPVRIYLEKLYEIEITPYTTPSPSIEKESTREKIATEKDEEIEKAKEELETDRYRESI